MLSGLFSAAYQHAGPEIVCVKAGEKERQSRIVHLHKILSKFALGVI